MIRLIPQPADITETGGFCEKPDNIVCIKTSVVDGGESYHLNVEKTGITVKAKTDRGLFYGRKTAGQLRNFYPDGIPCCRIHDAPVYSYRGFMIDSARHMQTVRELKRIIDAAASLKYNVFHWHLSDDQGFRIELSGFPEITEKASIRPCDNFGKACRDDAPYGGYYTKAEIEEIVSYCRERFIEVIPEIDLPGHFSAILSVHPELSCKGKAEIKTRQGIYKDILCAGNPDSLTFLKKLFDELCEMFPGPYFHIGGDEAPKDNWKECPACQKEIRRLGLRSEDELQIRFCHEAAKYLRSKGKKCIVWNDILKGGAIPSELIVQRWMDIKHLSAKAAQNGNSVIISNYKPYYLDYSYGQYPLKTVYGFTPGKEFTAEAKKNILGVETPLWTEYVNSPEKLEYQLFPRWFAVAESGWSKDANKDYKAFEAASKKLCRYFSAEGIRCAPEKDWNMTPLRRAGNCLAFYYRALAK